MQMRETATATAVSAMMIGDENVMPSDLGILMKHDRVLLL
jgi:hypothetical protein